MAVQWPSEVERVSGFLRQMGAEARIEDSVRQSAYFGFHRTKQIVLDLLVGEAQEISWIFTLDEG